jgi:alkaline phosphatase D
VLFLGDYIYEYASPPTALRHHVGPTTLSLDDYRARYAQYKSDPALQAAHAIAPWITLWDDHEVENDYAGNVPQTGPNPHFAARRAFAVQAYWEHMPFPKAMRPRGSEMRLFERYDWGRLARIHTLDGRAYRDEQVCKRFGRARSNTVPLADCPAMLDPKRSLPGLAQERWLAEGWDMKRPWNLLAQQTLMARLSWADPAEAGGEYWNDGWDGYAPSRQRLLAGVAERKLPGAVVLGGDVHANYIADLKVDYDNAKSPVIATEFCGTSIASHGMAQSRVDAALPFNPHLRYARSDERGYVSFVLGAKRLDAQLHKVLHPRDPSSEVNVAARFSVELGEPGAKPA